MTLLLFGIVVNNRRASVAAFETAPAWIDQPATQLVASLSPALTRSEASEITILAPAVATDSRTPTIDWVAQPQKTYDVIVAAAADPERPLWRVEAQRPPLRWSSHNPPLSPGSAYLLVVREHGRSLTASQRRFVTGTEAEAPRPATATPEDVANLEAELVRALFAAEPARIGDAWLLWNQLPHESRESGRGKRIHLVLTARLGWTSEFERLAAELAR